MEMILFVYKVFKSVLFLFGVLKVGRISVNKQFFFIPTLYIQRTANYDIKDIYLPAQYSHSAYLSYVLISLNCENQNALEPITKR